MKIPVYVETEVEVNISAEQIIDAIYSLPEPETTPALLKCLNIFANFLTKMKDEQIAILMEGQRKIVSEFLVEHAMRFYFASDLKPQPPEGKLLKEGQCLPRNNAG